MALTERNHSGPAAAGSQTARPPWRLVGVLTVVFIAAALLITYLRGHPAVYLAPVFDIPAHPTTAQAPYGVAQNVGTTIGMGVVGLIGVGLGVNRLLRTGSWLPLVLALSAAMITFPEVFYDVIGAVYFPYSHTQPLGYAYSFLGREMPVWIVMGWFGYGIFSFGIYLLLERRPTTKMLWIAWGAAMLGDIVFEEVLLRFGTYYYYGNQPLILISKLPWWWIPCNSVGVILAAALAYRFRASLQGWRSLAMLVITPMSVTAVYGFIALPSWIAVNSDLPWLPTQLLGLATLALGVVAFTGVLRLVLDRDPFELDHVPAEGEFLPAEPARVS